jgi:hypothetical protein
MLGGKPSALRRLLCSQRFASEIRQRTFVAGRDMPGHEELDRELTHGMTYSAPPGEHDDVLMAATLSLWGCRYLIGGGFVRQRKQRPKGGRALRPDGRHPAADRPLRPRFYGQQ